MTEIIFIFPIFSQLSRIFSRRTRSRYAMRFTFNASGKKTAQSKCFPHGQPKSPIRRRMFKASCAYEAFAMLLFSVGRSFHHLMSNRPSFQT